MSRLSDRPHIESIHIQALPFEVPTFPRVRIGQAKWKTLSRSEDGAEGTFFIEAGAGASLSVSDCESTAVSVFVLDGELQLLSETVGVLDFARLFPTSGEAHICSEHGFKGLVFIEGAGRSDGDRGLTVVRERELTWKGEVDSHFALGAVRKDIWSDPDDGSEVFLLGTIPLRWNTRSQVHPVAEEVFVIDGDLIGPRGVSTAGGYLWRPAGIWHGPFGQRSGALLLIRSYGGELSKVYDQKDSVINKNPPYAPILPPDLVYDRRMDERLSLLRTLGGATG